MFSLIVKRILWMIPTLLAISIISFVIIQLPPGDYLTAYISALGETGETVDADLVEALRNRYNLDEPIYVQYIRWMKGLLKGDLGMSFEWNKPVKDLIFQRLLLTVTISIATLLFVYATAIPIGIYSAVNQYSWGDYTFTFLGFIGLAIPNFLFALVLMFGKLFSKEPLLKKIFANSIKLLDEGWKKFNDRWILFFFFLAILNEIVWRTQSEEFWVNFKVWGLLPISFLFTASQVPLIKKYQIKK